MKEKLYTIPVNDAFDRDCECPICAMRKVLEDNAVEYTMGPSYMEDDVRAETDRLGFCQEHMRQLNLQRNKLGLALILKTHLDKTNKDIIKLAKHPIKGNSLFRKNVDGSPLLDYIDNLNQSCFICSRIDQTFGRYIITVVQLYKTDSAFKEKYKASKGFCTEHLASLIRVAQKELSGDLLNEFVKTTTDLYVNNMKRMADDLSWFVDKFDYKNADAPWKNSRDAITRAIIKTNGLIESEEKKKN